MKILYITPSFQHPLVRGPHRHYYFIKELSRRHEITLLALSRAEIAPEARKEMETYTRDLYTFDINGHSQVGTSLAKLPMVGSQLQEMAKLRDGVQKMRDLFRKIVREREFDLVLFHGKSLFPVIKDWNELPIVTDFCDATSMRIRSKMRHVGAPKRLLLSLRYWQFRHVEKLLLKKSTNVAFISHRDRAAVNGKAADSRIIPIGVDHQYWSRSSDSYQENCIIFTGVMDYGPNHDAAVRLIERVLPRLQERIPDIELIIAGRDPRPELKTKARRWPCVTVTGFVEDMRPYLEKAAAMAAPLLYASGIQNKVLEAMSMQVPVVTTGIVSDGLHIDEYGDPPVCVAESDEAFAESLARLVINRAERNRLASESRAFVERYFNWTQSAHILEDMCKHALNGKASTGHHAAVL